MITNNLPLVSVIITTYKRADFLSRAINSVLAQDYTNIEIVVVDDNDPQTEFREKTEKILQPYIENEQVVYIKHEKNLNGAYARNTGIQHSRGELITFLDDDDLYEKQKVSAQVEYLVNHSQFRAVYCGWERDGKIETPFFEGDLSFEILAGTLLIRTNTIMMYKEISNKIGNWDGRYSRNQEAAYLLRYFKSGEQIGSVDKALVFFDTSDRGNAANPQKNEENFVFFLTDQKEFMEQRFNKKQIKDIISFRMRGVLLGYLKSKDYYNAFKLYGKMMLRFPLKFNHDILDYAFKRLDR